MGRTRCTTARTGTRAALATVLLAAATVVVAPPASACACGGIVDNPAYETTVTAETAALQWDGEQETVLLELTGLSDAPEVGLLLPTPSAAEVTLADPDVFEELDRVTAPRDVVAENRWWPELSFDTAAGGDGAGAAPGVTVIDEVRLGPLDVTTLAATDSRSLRTWLDDNAFELSPSIRTALEPYVKEKWSFVAARIAPEAAQSFDGTLQPLRVTFPSKHLVYPMRMSTVAEDTQSTRTYVLADHRMDRDDATARTDTPVLRFAGPVDPGDVDSTELAALLENGGYVTAYEQTFTEPSTQILSDFTFTQAETDATVVRTNAVVADKRIGPFFAGPVLAFAAMLALAVLLVWSSRRHRAPVRVRAAPHPVRV